MEVKQILEKIRQPKEEKKEYLFALQINLGLVKSAIWTVEQDRVKILSIGDNQPWRNEKELIEAVDESLSSAAEKISPEEEAPEVNKVIFGLPSEWVEGERIVSDKIKLLRTLSQKLELTPVGFVVTVEAIIHHLKNTEGVPPTAILLGLSEERLLVTLTNLGKIIGREIVKRSDHLGADLAEGLSRFESEVQFPARVLLYDAQEQLEEARQALISYSWQEEKVKFLHLPRVEILSSDFDIKAVALAGGYEVARVEGIVVAEEAKLPCPPEGRDYQEEPEEKPEPELMGFVKGRDIAREVPQKEKEESPLPGFPSVNFPQFKLPRLGFLAIKEAFSRFSLGQRLPSITGVVAGFILIIGGILGGLYWYLPQAVVVLSLAPQKLEKEFTLKLDPSLEVANEEDLILPAQEVKAVIEGEKTRGTTGTKTVGEPAKGEVIIYNRTASEKTFPAGTEITGPNELKFSLDDEVRVASESAGPDYTKIPGKAKVGATALEIGTEGNLASETEFSVANFATSDLIAKNETAFSGGTSREVEVVSEDDQDKLVGELKEELQDKALVQLSAKVGEGQKLLEESVTTGVVEKAFDKEVGEEAPEFKLSLKLEATALSFNEEEPRTLIEERIKSLIPSGFEYKREESEIVFNLKDLNKDGSALFSVQFRANLLPIFDLEEIKKNLAGKYPQIGKTYLDNLPNVEGVEIKIFPRLPSKLATFPRIAKRIKIELEVR